VSVCPLMRKKPLVPLAQDYAATETCI
jgi:hypothetical protein